MATQPETKLPLDAESVEEIPGDICDTGNDNTYIGSADEESGEDTSEDSSDSGSNSSSCSEDEEMIALKQKIENAAKEKAQREAKLKEQQEKVAMILKQKEGRKGKCRSCKAG